MAALLLCSVGLAAEALAQSGFYGPSAIVPGVLIGRVHLGGDLEAETRDFGADTGGTGGMGHVINTWKAHDGRTITLASAMVGAGPDYAVREVRATSSFFKTREGIGVGSSLRAVQHAFPDARPVNHTRKSLYIGSIALLEDEGHGIAFEFPVVGNRLSTSAACTAVTIHAAGKNVLVINPPLYKANSDTSLSVDID